jgi:NitT/TauT family transport system substrate-binding protein
MPSEENAPPQTNNLDQPQTQPSPPPNTPEPAAKEPKQSKSKPKLLLLIVGVIIALLVAGGAYALFNKAAKKTPVATELTKVSMQMGWLHQAQFAGFYVAKEKGFYKEAGLDVTLSEYKEGEDLNQKVSDGKIDFATTTPLEVVAARDKGNKIKAITAIYQTSPYCFVSPKSANIKTPADLKGKILGYVGNNPQAQVVYPAILASYGISASQVTTKEIGFDIVENFKNRAADTADIYRTDQTYLLDKAGIPYNILLPEQFGFGLYGDVVVASDNAIKNRSDVVDKFTKATLRGVQYALDHEDEAIVMTAKYENELYKDADYEKHILKSSATLIRPTGNQRLGNMEFVPWNRAHEAIKSAGLLKNDYNVSDAYTTKFID